MKYKIIVYLGLILIIISQKFLYDQNAELKRDLREITQNQEILNKKYQDNIQVLQDNYKDILSQRETISNDILRLNKEQEDLNRKLNQKKTGEERDFQELLNKKSGLMENIINNGTKEVLDCFRDQNFCEVPK